MSASRIRVPLLGRMLVLLLLLALVPMIVVGTVSLRRGADAVGQTAEQNLQLIAATTAARLDDAFAQAQRLQAVIATTDTVVNACAAPPARRKDLLPVAERWLREVVAAAPDIALAYLADDQGVCIVSTSPNMVGLDYRKTREYMRRALAGENAISDLAVGITTREPGIFLSGPVKGRDGRIAGAAVLKLRGAIVDRVCSDVSRQIPQGFAVLVDANEVVISHPDPKLLYHSLGTLSPEAAQAHRRQGAVRGRAHRARRAGEHHAGPAAGARARLPVLRGGERRAAGRGVRAPDQAPLDRRRDPAPCAVRPPDRRAGRGAEVVDRRRGRARGAVRALGQLRAAQADPVAARRGGEGGRRRLVGAGRGAQQRRTRGPGAGLQQR